MKNKILLILFIYLLPLLGFSQQRWYSSFGLPGERESTSCVSESYDNGYFVSGGLINEAALVAKAGINGDLSWYKVLKSGIYFDRINAHCELPDGSKVLVGHAGPDPLIVKLNACGDIEWCNKFNNPDYYLGGYFLDLISFGNGNILVLATMVNFEEEGLVFLFSFNSNGELKWKKQYIKYEVYPDLRYPYPWSISLVDGEYIISGDCYYRTKFNQDLFALRPMFIKIDEQFIEDWLLPFGHNIDSFFLLGSSFGVIEKIDSIYKGYGMYSHAGEVGGLFNFNTEGLETDYYGIYREELNDSLWDNMPRKMEKINDTLLMVSAVYKFSHSDIAMGDYIASYNGNVYGNQFHENSVPAFHSMIKTDSSQFVFVGEILQDDEWDIFLYKLNDDLSSAPILTDTITYDYLCDDLPIVSDTIDLSACGIITGIEDIPSPEEYYAGLENIPINIYPNPAQGKIILNLEDKVGGSIESLVKCFNTSGHVMYENNINGDSEQMEINISQWQSGIYIAVVTDDKGKKGSVKFVVE